MCLIKLDPSMEFDAPEPLRSPGDVLLNDHLKARAMSLAWLARRTGISVSTLRQITRGERRINARFAMRLACVMDPTPAYWLTLQARYDLATLESWSHVRRHPE
ncbi:HigA family addiction module antitoxin [Dyella jiangningensis]|uniref:Addiction module antidote protein, HigA family n=1 Tax=Dyella jiangningensis TaxID=1379159 RepID=A0A328NYG0_9GAMM|nr:HigA family addiction module antitoxin [Dyella jiangningensis]RAO74919.1 addiction module antidote protein, HigA family [Dyella jiangningensis]